MTLDILPIKLNGTINHLESEFDIIIEVIAKNDQEIHSYETKKIRRGYLDFEFDRHTNAIGSYQLGFRVSFKRCINLFNYQVTIF